MEKIGFCILTWNSEKYIKDCIEKILNIEDYETVISVVDNGSIDNTVNIIKSFGDKVILTENGKNLGTTISRNMAVKKIVNDCDYICFLDSDAFITDSKIGKIIEKLSDKNIGIIGARTIDREGKLIYSARNIPTLKEKLYKVLPIKKAKEKALLLEHIDYDTKPDLFYTGYLMGAFLLMKKNVFEDIGYFDEKIFYAPEDVEYCLRCWGKGYKVAYFKDYTITHLWQRLSKKKVFSKHNLEHVKGLLYVNRKFSKKLKEKIKKETV